MRRYLSVNLGDIDTPAGAVRYDTKDETEGRIIGIKKSEG